MIRDYLRACWANRICRVIMLIVAVWLAVTATITVMALVTAGTAHAQDDPTSPASTPPPTSVTPSPTPTASATTTTPSTPATTSATTTSEPSSSSTAAAPSTSRAQASARAVRVRETSGATVAPPGPTTPTPATTTPTAASSETYSALTLWIPADDHPEIGLAAVLLIVVGGVGFGVMYERGPRRSQ